MKFNIGDMVKAPDGEVGKILSVRIDEAGVHYVMSSKEVDLQKKEVLNGVKHLDEEELEAADDFEVALSEPEEEENA